MTDMVNHPPHYKKYKLEVIELTEKFSFCLGNAFKYILRAPFKGKEIEDLEKAKWYLNRFKTNKEKAPHDLGLLALAKNYENRLFINVICFVYAGDIDAAISYIDERIKELTK